MTVGKDWTGAGEDAGEEIGAESIGAQVLVGTGLAVFCGVTGGNVFVD